MKNDILNTYNQQSDHLIARTLRCGILLVIICAIANYTDVFIIDIVYMMMMVLSAVAAFLVPTVLFDKCHLHQLWIRLLVLTLVVLTSGMMYAILSYHVVIMFLLPVCIACLYDDKRYPIFTMLITIPVLVSVHFIAFDLAVVPDEPLVTIKGVIYYGIIPRLIQFLGGSLICIEAADRSHQLILSLLQAKQKQDKAQDILKQIIYESEQLMSTRHLDDIVRQSVQAVKNLLLQLGDDASIEAPFMAGYLLSPEEQTYYLITDKAAPDHHQTSSEKTVAFDGHAMRLRPPHRPSREVAIADGILTMRFYEEGVQRAFLFIKCSLKEQAETMNFLTMLYTNMKKSYENAGLHMDLINMQKELIQALAEICESKSDQTGQHIKRVGEYMKAMGRNMALDEETCEMLCMAAMLHDVGKLKVPDSILEKPGKLTQEEFEEIKKHVHTGKQLLDNCPGEMMKIGKTIAYQHHEKWDGTGYLHYKGEEIDEYAALVAVIDVFDALVSRRSYKNAWTPQDAYDEIVSSSGTHFSPQAVALFKKTYPQLLKILETYPD